MIFFFCTKSRIGDLHAFYCLWSFVTEIKSWRIRVAGSVARMEKIAHGYFVGQSERKRSHEGLESIEDDNIKMFIKMNV